VTDAAAMREIVHRLRDAALARLLLPDCPCAIAEARIIPKHRYFNGDCKVLKFAPR
jgi:hypothetical protein